MSRESKLLAIVVMALAGKVLQHKNEERERNIEQERLNKVWNARRNTPCKFKDGMSREEFEAIIRKQRKRFKRIKRVEISDTVVYCTVISQSGCSEWCFSIDFNDWGHVTGARWLDSDNQDSSIPRRFGRDITEAIRELYRERGVETSCYDDLIQSDTSFGTSNELSYHSDAGDGFHLFRRKFKCIETLYAADELRGEHVYVVFSLMKKNGFKNIEVQIIEDVDAKSNAYPFEVGEVMISGVSDFEKAGAFPLNAQVIITYHVARNIRFPYSQRELAKMTKNQLSDELSDLGFSNIYFRGQCDLVLDLFHKEDKVQGVVAGEKEDLVERGQSYCYSTKLIIVYHSMK